MFGNTPFATKDSRDPLSRCWMHLKDPVDVWKNALRYKGLTGHIRSSLDAFKRSS